VTVHDADAQRDETTPPSPRPRGVLGRRLAFREPSPEELETMLSPEAGRPPLTGEEPLEEDPGFDSAGPPSGESDPGSGETSSGQSDTRAGRRGPLKVASDEARQMAHNGVFLASVRVQAMLARSQEQIDLGMYVADEQDQEQIGTPLADIAARRAGVSSDNPDVNDAISALIGVANYVVKQVQLSAVARRMHREATPPQIIPGEVA
jgi:hypothetical protein